MKRRRIAKVEYGHLRPAAKAAAYTAARVAVRAARGLRSLTRTNRTNDVARAITQQHDSRQLYTRKKLSRKKARKRVKKYLSFLSKQLMAIPPQQLYFSKSGSSGSAANLQGNQFLYSGGGFAGGDSGSVGSFVRLVENQLNTASPFTLEPTLYIVGMSIDYTIVNDSEGTMELDVYDFRTKRDARLNHTSLESFYTTEFSDQLLIGNNSRGTDTKITPIDLAASPFNAPGFCKVFTINGKRRFYISPGQTISWTDNVVFRKPYKYDNLISENVSEQDVYVIAGVTRGVLLTHKGVPSAENACAAPTTLRYCCQSVYRYKFMEPNQPATEVYSK